MRIVKMLVAVGIVALALSCVPSLHPLFTAKDVTFDPTLVGTWSEKDKTDTWTFTKSGENAYGLVITEEGVPGKFEAHLVRLGEMLFLDLYPEEPDIKNTFYKIHLIPAHTFYRIWIDKEKDVVRIAGMNPDWLKENLDEKKITIAHERIGEDAGAGNIVLTAPTKDLQEFVVKHAADGFGEPGELHRQKTEAAVPKKDVESAKPTP
jgi:hypothetical protein